MEAAFTENAYQILGLPVSAEQSEIKKRARLLIAQIAIGENKLPTDLSICGLDRTEDLVKNAVQRLSTPQGKTREVYFWFSDEGVDYLPKSGTVSDIEKAVQHLSMRSAQKGKWNAKRDHAVFLMRLLFFKKSKKKYLLESLGLWKDLIHADSAWKYFGLYFKNIDDVQLGDSVMVNLRQWVDTTVSDLYSELSEKWNDAEYALAYTKVFGKISRHAHKNILTPRANEIEKATQDLGSIVWHDGALSKKNVDEVKKCVAIIQNALNKLMDSDLYEEPDVIAIRDKASDAIRSVAIDLTNQYDDFERSALLLSIAEEISGTHSTKTRTQSEKKTVEDNRATQKFLVPVLDLINKGKFLKAVEYIEHQMAVNEDDPRALKILKSQLTPVMGRYITETRSSAMEKLEKKDFQGAIGVLSGLRNYGLKNLDYFDLERGAVERMLADVDSRILIVTKTNMDTISGERDAVVKNLLESLGETTEVGVVMSLLDCAYYVPILHFLQKLSGKNQTLQVLYTIGWWTVLFYGFGLLFLIPAWIWDNSELRYVRE